MENTNRVPELEVIVYQNAVKKEKVPELETKTIGRKQETFRSGQKNKFIVYQNAVEEKRINEVVHLVVVDMTDEIT